MRVATFNAHDNAGAVRRSLELAGLLLWQEYPGHPIASRGWRQQAGGKGVVTGWRLRWWTFEAATWHQAHGARRLVTPARGTLVVILRHRGTGALVAVLNGHRINGWKGSGRLRSFPTWRAARWREHLELDRRLVAQLLEDGMTVIGGGDYNTAHPDRLHRDQRQLATGRNDHLWVIESAAGPRVRVLEADAVLGRLGSDHQLRRATVRLRRQRETVTA